MNIIFLIIITGLIGFSWVIGGVFLFEFIYKKVVK